MHKSIKEDSEWRNKHRLIGWIYFLESTKLVQWRKDSLLNKWCWQIEYFCGKKIKTALPYKKWASELSRPQKKNDQCLLSTWKYAQN